MCVKNFMIAVWMGKQHGIEMMDAAAYEKRYDDPFAHVLGGRCCKRRVAVFETSACIDEICMDCVHGRV